MKVNKTMLNAVYMEYNKRELVSPDPLQFLYNYHTAADIEIVALTAASLAYGRVAQILKSTALVLNLMHPSPYEFLMNSDICALRRTLNGFKHRFTTGDDLAFLLAGAGKIIKEYGSLEECFSSALCAKHETIIPALEIFAEKVCCFYRGKPAYLFPAPSRGSACKRPMLFLRWMVRSDEVDPGVWTSIPTSKLVVPLDTHMHKIASLFGFTKRKTADLKSAMEITAEFAEINPDDPVKYDFALTRFGIRSELDIADIQRQFG